jgi:uncharacterized lipoprotein YmbA
MLARTLAIAFVAIIAGCHSSPPKRFYVLDAIAGDHALVSQPGDPIQVAEINIPPSLDRQEMVREDAPDSLQISDVHRWGAPLADMIQNVLTQNLIHRLPAGRVIPPRTAAPAGTHEITVDILKFERDSSGQVVLDGGWSLYRLGSDTPILTRHVALSERIPADYDAQAHAMSRLLSQLADDIAANASSTR